MPPDTETTTTFENFGLLVCDTPVLYPFLHSSLTWEKNWPREGCSAIGGYLDKQSFYIMSNSSHIHPVTSNTTYRKTPHPQPHTTHTHIEREGEGEYWCGLESVSMVSTADFLKPGWTRAARATKPPIECPTSITLDGKLPTDWTPSFDRAKWDSLYWSRIYKAQDQSQIKSIEQNHAQVCSMKPIWKP